MIDESDKSIFSIPVHYSNLQIYIPKNEKILGSAFYKIAFIRGYYPTFPPRLTGIRQWYTHVLFTEKGFYFGEYQKRRPPRITFLPWYKVKKLKRKSIWLSESRYEKPDYEIKMKRELNFETRKSYKKRKKEFSRKFTPIMKEGIQTYLFQGKDILRPYGIYDDIRKNRMKNQFVFSVLDGAGFYVSISFLLTSIPLTFLEGLVPYTILMITVNLGILILTFFHWSRLRKKNFALRKEVNRDFYNI